MRRKVRKKIAITDTLRAMEIGDEIKLSIFDADRAVVSSIVCRLNKGGEMKFQVGREKSDPTHYSVIRYS